MTFFFSRLRTFLQSLSPVEATAINVTIGVSAFSFALVQHVRDRKLDEQSAEEEKLRQLASRVAPRGLVTMPMLRVRQIEKYFDRLEREGRAVGLSELTADELADEWVRRRNHRGDDWTTREEQWVAGNSAETERPGKGGTMKCR